jgi:hypothetical protein
VICEMCGHLSGTGALSVGPPGHSLGVVIDCPACTRLRAVERFTHYLSNVKESN